MTTIVEVKDLSHRYGSRVALDGVSFEVAVGETLGLLGPNGSGKTTLFRILATLLRPDGGTARISGLDVGRDRDAVRARLGVVFQSPSLDGLLTVRENLIHGGRLYGMAGSALRARIGDLLGPLGLADRANDRVNALSGGLRRRVELAKSLLHKPPVLVLDEPSTGLDPAARNEFWEQLDRLRETTSVTVLFTTHGMDEAERCDRLAILDRGRPVAMGAPDELKDRVGGACITIRSDDPSALQSAIGEQMDCNPQLVDGLVRIESPAGEDLTAHLLRRFGAEILSLAIGKPTLEDVFLHETGRHFEEVAA